MPRRQKKTQKNSTVRKAGNIIRKTKSAIQKKISGFTQMLTSSKKRKSPRKKSAAKRSTQATSSQKKGASVNRQAQWNAYKALEREINKAWDRLREDVKKGAAPQILNRDKNNLLLLLGECNYMARECGRIQNRARR